MAVNSAFKTILTKSKRVFVVGIYHRSHLRQSRSITTSTSENGATSSGSRRPEPAAADNMMDIGIRAILNEDHDLLRRSVRRFVQEEVIPQQRGWEMRGYPDPDIIKQGSRAGICGLNCPVEDHGLGGSVKDESILWDEFCYGNSSVGAAFHLTNGVVLPYLIHHGTPEQKEKYIKRVVNDGLIASIGMTESAAGSDLQGLQTTAKRHGDDWVINGSKMYITNGYNCHFCLVVAKTSPDARKPAHGISLFLVDADTPGFVKGKPLKKLGMNASDTAPLFFDEVRVPSQALLGEANKGFYYMMSMLPMERLLAAGMHMGLAEFMFETTREYVKSRKAFNRRLADLQVIQHKLAEIKTDVCTSRAFMDQCLETSYHGGLTSSTASMVKYWVTEVCDRVGSQCVQLHGGTGYMEDSEICRAYATARAGPIYAGANEIMKELISRQIVKT